MSQTTPEQHDSHVFAHGFTVVRDDVEILHDAHVGEYEHSLYAKYYLDEEEAGTHVDDEVCDYPPYRPCCQCGEEDSEHDSFMDRFICGPCWTAEDDAVANAERRSNRSLC